MSSKKETVSTSPRKYLGLVNTSSNDRYLYCSDYGSVKLEPGAILIDFAYEVEDIRDLDHAIKELEKLIAILKKE